MRACGAASTPDFPLGGGQLEGAFAGEEVLSGTYLSARESDCYYTEMVFLS